MSTLTWTDALGRSYTYKPHEAKRVASEEFHLSSGAVLAATEAARRFGQLPLMPLAGIAAVLFRSESAASSLIEGIEAGPRRVLEAEFAEPNEVRDPHAERVVSNLRALVDALETEPELEASDLLNWHRLLNEGHPEIKPDQVGAFRTVQNWIGGDSTGPRNAVFVPPAPEHVRPLIEDLLRFAARTDLAGIPAALIAHAQFEVIHPFVDGNGRVGRLLLQSVLTHRHGIDMPIPVSVPWNRDKDRYLAALRQYQDGDVEAWIEFGATSIVTAIDWMLGAAEKIQSLIEELRSRSRTRGGSVAARIVADLPTNPLVDITTVAARYGTSRQAAHQALTRLVSRGTLSEFVFSRKVRTVGRPRKYLCSPELNALLVGLLDK